MVEGLIGAIYGALFRRSWGGWFSPCSAGKRILGFFIPFFMGLWCFGVEKQDVMLSVFMAAIVSLGWMMPLHGYGIAMGRDERRPLWACLCVMTAQYGCLTLLGGVVAWCVTKCTGALLYAPLGFFVAPAYWLAWEAWERLEMKPFLEYPKGNWFMDGPTSLGELVLGAVLVGGIALIP